MVWASSGDGIAYKTTDGKADAAEYDDGLSVLEEFGVRFVLDEADSECDGAGQQEDDAEVEQGDPTTQTLVSVPGACLVPETSPLHGRYLDSIFPVFNRNVELPSKLPVLDWALKIKCKM